MGHRIEGAQHNGARTDVTIPSKLYSRSGITLENLSPQMSCPSKSGCGHRSVRPSLFDNFDNFATKVTSPPTLLCEKSCSLSTGKWMYPQYSEARGQLQSEPDRTLAAISLVSLSKAELLPESRRANKRSKERLPWRLA